MQRVFRWLWKASQLPAFQFSGFQYFPYTLPRALLWQSVSRFTHHVSLLISALPRVAPFLDQAPAAAVRRRRPIGARRAFDGVAGFRRPAGLGASWHRIQYSPKAIAPPTSSRNRSGDARLFLKGRKGLIEILYTRSRSITSSVRVEGRRTPCAAGLKSHPHPDTLARQQPVNRTLRANSGLTPVSIGA